MFSEITHMITIEPRFQREFCELSMGKHLIYPDTANQTAQIKTNFQYVLSYMFIYFSILVETHFVWNQITSLLCTNIMEYNRDIYWTI